MVLRADRILFWHFYSHPTPLEPWRSYRRLKIQTSKHIISMLVHAELSSSLFKLWQGCAYGSTYILLKVMVCSMQQLTQHRDMEVAIPTEFVFACVVWNIFALQKIITNLNTTLWIHLEKLVCVNLDAHFVPYKWRGKGSTHQGTISFTMR